MSEKKPRKTLPKKAMKKTKGGSFHFSPPGSTSGVSDGTSNTFMYGEKVVTSRIDGQRLGDGSV